MENKRKIINIVNFIRGYNSEWQPFGETYRTVKKQIELIDKYNFKATFLLQYDALTFPCYQELMTSLDKDRYEFGVWFEIQKPFAEDCGIRWTGRRNWDGHVHSGFSMGYTQQERKLLLDKLFEQFRSVFGYYPRVFGSWFFDTFTANYVCEKYGIDAFCNCKEQHGTDGYTLWGGYYGQAYYPSRKNVFMPAQNKEMQMSAPLFRMLGSDQVYQYDFGMNEDFSPKKSQSVITLEPVYHDAGGGLKKWVDWYMKENYNGECLSFSYAQAGQENSFGWRKMQDGLTYQFALFDRLVKDGRLEIETLGESGRWFKENYDITPASSITAHSAYDDSGKSSVWFCNKNYRINLYVEEEMLRVRDFHLFDEKIEDEFENKVCTENAAVYESLPLADGYLWSGSGIKSGIYIKSSGGEDIRVGKMSYKDNNDGSCTVNYESNFGDIEFTIGEKSISVRSEKDFTLENIIGRRTETNPQIISVSEKNIVLSYNGVNYSVTLQSGVFTQAAKAESENGLITAAIAVC